MTLSVLDNRVASSDITAELDSPGKPTPINLKKANGNKIEAAFFPTEEGTYKVTGGFLLINPISPYTHADCAPLKFGDLRNTASSLPNREC